jgi:deoxyribodipyrimidine photo-lyase
MSAQIKPLIVWFRQDLRVQDNPCLSYACLSGKPLVAIFILEEDLPRKLGGASKWWLHHSLIRLRDSLDSYGITLNLLKGESALIIQSLIDEFQADEVVWNRCYEPDRIARDQAIMSQLKSQGVQAHSYNASLLIEPWQNLNRSGAPFQVFTPYFKAMQSRIRPAQTPALPTTNESLCHLNSENLEDWNLTPSNPNWAENFSKFWHPGEQGAKNRLDQFFSSAIEGYRLNRNHPDRDGTSRLSPHLHWGEISPFYVYHKIIHHQIENPQLFDDCQCFYSEIAWREFSYHLLYHFPRLTQNNLKSRFDSMPWENNMDHFSLWKNGQTGYPIVDAGMRQLWQTGWMHNRVRMICASFLIKDLLIDWRKGEEWFWDTLVDADLANNCASWQWVAGSGADAAPFFRIFNPVLQGEKFDPNGEYVRQFVPELKHLPSEYIHRPWEAPKNVLLKGSVVLGKDYPAPVLDHSAARAKALQILKDLSFSP